MAWDLEERRTEVFSSASIAVFLLCRLITLALSTNLLARVFFLDATGV